MGNSRPIVAFNLNNTKLEEILYNETNFANSGIRTAVSGNHSTIFATTNINSHRFYSAGSLE